jgi:hypothetical protein
VKATSAGARGLVEAVVGAVGGVKG